MDLLIQLGPEIFKGSGQYILEPHRGISYKTMMNNLSKGFCHFYIQAFPLSEPKQFKILRKTYILHLNKEISDCVTELTSHGSKKVLKTHYLDKELIAKGAMMRFFI